MKFSFALSSLAIASLAYSEVIFNIQKFDGSKIGFLNTLKSGDKTYFGVGSQSQRFDFDRGVVSGKVDGKDSKLGIDNNLLVFSPDTIPQSFWLFGDGLAPHTFWLCPGSIDTRSSKAEKVIFGLMNSDKPDHRCEMIYLNREICDLVIPHTTADDRDYCPTSATDASVDCLASTSSSWTNGTLTYPAAYTSYTTYCPEPTVITITTCEVEQCYKKVVTITAATTLTCDYCVVPTTATATATTLLTKAAPTKPVPSSSISKPVVTSSTTAPKQTENKPDNKPPSVTVKNNAAVNSLGCAVLFAVGAYIL